MKSCPGRRLPGGHGGGSAGRALCRACDGGLHPRHRYPAQVIHRAGVGGGKELDFVISSEGCLGESDSDHPE